jgi:hypothetical protein
LSGLNDFERRVLNRYREQSRPVSKKRKRRRRMSSPLTVDYLGFMERFGAGPRETRIRIRPETLARCERMVGTTEYMRWYLREMYGRLHT